MNQFEADVTDRLARIETKLDTAVDTTKSQENRISSLEKKLWWFSGASAVIAWLVTNLFSGFKL